MLVHFPIVMLMTMVPLDVYMLASGGSLTARHTLPKFALANLGLGTLAILAAVLFGGVAYDIAVQRGFAEAALESHEEMAMTTLYVFAVAAAARLFCYWRGIDLAGIKGWSLALVGAAGVALLVVTASRGGHLVFDLGVNVARLRG